MDKPVIVSKKPIMIDLEKGKTYYWCACGKSKIVCMDISVKLFSFLYK